MGLAHADSRVRSLNVADLLGEWGEGMGVYTASWLKENVPDLRNTRVVDIIAALKERGFQVDVHDAFADADEAQQFYGIDLLPSLGDAKGYHCVIGAVPHEPYCDLGADGIAKLLEDGGLIADIKGMWRNVETPKGYRRWQL